MKKLAYLSVAAVLLSAGACKKDPSTEKGSLRLTFKGKFDTETLVFFNKYALSGGDSLRMTTLEYFLSDIRLVNADGDTVSISEVNYIDFENNHDNSSTAPNGESIVIADIPAADYSQILFGVGVSPELNATEPGNHSTTSPLGDNGNYWTAWDSYIFSRVEGHLFPVGASQISFLYHGGVDGMYQPRSFAKSLSIQNSQTTDIVFHLDAKKIFIPTSGNSIDIANNNSSHSGAVGTDGYNLAVDVISNLANAIEIQ